MRTSLAVCIIVAVAIAGFLLGYAAHRAPEAKFAFLSPDISRMNVEEFQAVQQRYRTYYAPLRDGILEDIGDRDVAVYFEDLTTGGWVGINERSLYRGASLMKVVTIATALSAIEDGALAMDTRVRITPEERDARFGALYDAAENASLTVEELMYATAAASDNTASNALRNATGLDRWWATFQGLGLPAVPENVTYVSVTAKGYGNMFRNLYYSGYLRRTHSEYVLSLLAHTEFSDALSAGVPPDVPVSHKIGVYSVQGAPAEKQYHDCGIVYAERPYFLCVLTRGIPEDEAKALITRVSADVYAYVTQ